MCENSVSAGSLWSIEKYTSWSGVGDRGVVCRDNLSAKEGVCQVNVKRGLSRMSILPREKLKAGTGS